jgi:hypothetical protein
MSYSDWSADLASGQITCTTEIVRTLGVNENTYLILAIVGTIASGALGSGWLFKLFELLSSYRKRTLSEDDASSSEQNRDILE